MNFWSCRCDESWFSYLHDTLTALNLLMIFHSCLLGLGFYPNTKPRAKMPGIWCLWTWVAGAQLSLGIIISFMHWVPTSVVQLFGFSITINSWNILSQSKNCVSQLYFKDLEELVVFMKESITNKQILWAVLCSDLFENLRLYIKIRSLNFFLRTIVMNIKNNCHGSFLVLVGSWISASLCHVVNSGFRFSRMEVSSFFGTIIGT